MRDAEILGINQRMIAFQRETHHNIMTMIEQAKQNTANAMAMERMMFGSWWAGILTLILMIFWPKGNRRRMVYLYKVSLNDIAEMELRALEKQRDQAKNKIIKADTMGNVSGQFISPGPFQVH